MKSDFKARRARKQAAANTAGASAACSAPGAPVPASDALSPAPVLSPAEKQARRRWAALIQRVYQVDPLTCPHCGGAMKIVAFIEAHQSDVIQRILRHCGPWMPPPPPPRPPPCAQRSPAAPLARRGVPQRYGEMTALDPEFLEHLHREAQGEQLNLPWD